MVSYLGLVYVAGAESSEQPTAATSTVESIWPNLVELLSWGCCACDGEMKVGRR